MVGKGVGSGLVRDIEEGDRLPELHRRIKEKRVLAEARVQNYAFPDEFPAWMRRSEAFATRIQYRLIDVATSPTSGAVWVPNLAILQQSVGSIPRLYSSLKGTVDPLIPPKILDINFPIVVTSRHSYYHWLLEVIPEVMHARQLDPQTRIVIRPDTPELALKSQGFEIVFAEKLTIEEQMQLFSEAGHIIAPHGAGLSNIIACQVPVKIHEIFPDNYKLDCYARLAVQLGFDYSFSIAPVDKNGLDVFPVKEIVESQTAQ